MEPIQIHYTAEFIKKEAKIEEYATLLQDIRRTVLVIYHSYRVSQNLPREQKQ